MADKKRKTAEDESADDTFEIDLEESSTDHLQEIIDDAVAAVERDEEVSLPEDDEIDVDALVERLARTEAESTGLRDRLQRTLADFDNFRKRSEREKQAIQKMGIFDVVKEFLGVTDNLERAMAASGSIDDLKQGLELVLRQQGEILRRYGVEPVESVGKLFDPSVHEAVSRSESDEVDQPTVTAEMQKGYLLYDRLLRPAMVTVAVPSAPPVAETNDEASHDAPDASGEDDIAEGAGESE